MTPLHIALVDGHEVRFYRSPRNGPDFAWVAFRDVMAVAQFTSGGIDHWVEKWRDIHPELINELPDGTVIVPEMAGRGLFQWGVDQGWEAAAGLLRIFEEAASLTFCVQHAHLNRSEMLAVCRQAGLRNMTMIPGETHVH